MWPIAPVQAAGPRNSLRVARAESRSEGGTAKRDGAGSTPEGDSEASERPSSRLSGSLDLGGLGENAGGLPFLGLLFWEPRFAGRTGLPDSRPEVCLQERDWWVTGRESKREIEREKETLLSGGGGQTPVAADAGASVVRVAPEDVLNRRELVRRVDSSASIGMGWTGDRCRPLQRRQRRSIGRSRHERLRI